jgi:hypothetical protein
VWNPAHHSDQDNLTWSLLRAIEWGRWPIFLSQPVAPILLMFLNWESVVVGVVVANLAWALLVRYRFVSVPAAYLGAFFVKLKWLTCPTSGAYLLAHGAATSAVLALLWPLVPFVLGAVPTTQVGRIQGTFMKALDYERLT